jgi:hypothetical protein
MIQMNAQQKFNLKLMFAALPVFIWLGWLQGLPLNRFTFRSWEALFMGSSFFAPFYPNQVLETVENGDLAAFSPKGIPKANRFATDEWGYRNETPACTDPKIVIIGDSMAIGGATQSQTLAAQLSQRTGDCVRSFAGGNLNYATNSIFGLGLKPEKLILVLTQRTAGAITQFQQSDDLVFWGVHSVAALNPIAARYLQFRKNLYWNYRAQHGVMDALSLALGIRKRSEPVVPSELSATQNNPEHLFYQQDWNRTVSPNEMNRDIRNLASFAKRLESHKTQLVLIFVPNKSTIYKGPFEDQDPNFSLRFQHQLDNLYPVQTPFKYINLTPAFRSDYKNGIQSHHFDDTHWNAHGIKTAVDLLLLEDGQT